jgi:hypothetical protein
MNDLKFALRQVPKNPAFAAIAITTLALGIGQHRYFQPHRSARCQGRSHGSLAL